MLTCLLVGQGGSRRHLLGGLEKESPPSPATTKKPVGVTSQTAANSAALQDDPDIQNPGDSMFMVSRSRPNAPDFLVQPGVLC